MEISVKDILETEANIVLKDRMLKAFPMRSTRRQ